MFGSDISSETWTYNGGPIMLTNVLIIGDLVATDNEYDEVIGFASDGRPIMKYGGLSAAFMVDVIGHVWSDMERMAESDLSKVTLYLEAL